VSPDPPANPAPADRPNKRTSRGIQESVRDVFPCPDHDAVTLRDNIGDTTLAAGTLDNYFEHQRGYLAALVRTKWFWGRLADATRGAGARRERPRPEKFLCISLPMPSLDAQVAGEKLFADMEGLKQLQGQTSAELHSLLPAILDQAFRGKL
jgi:hypothetical protein